MQRFLSTPGVKSRILTMASASDGEFAKALRNFYRDESGNASLSGGKGGGTRGNTYASIDDLSTPTGQFGGRYEPNPKHDRPGGNVSPQPTNGEAVLADSVPIGGNSTGRIGYDASTGEIVVFQNHQGESYHGYVPSAWSDLRQAEKNALIRAGLFTPRGRPVR
jgi:hypothetical protein